MFKSLVISVLVLCAQGASARSYILPALSAHIRTAHLSPYLGLAADGSGMVQINYYKKTAYLEVDAHTICLPGTKCLVAGLPTQLKVQLPIVNREVNGCNVVTYIAREDRRAVDGTLRELKIYDYRKTTCRIRIMAPTYVEYTVVHARGHLKPIVSNILADTLVPSLPKEVQE